MTFIGWVILLIIVGFAALIALRTIPVYLTEYKVASAMKEIQNNYELRNATLHQLRRALQKRLNINEVNVVKAKEAKIVKKGNGIRIFSLPYKQLKPVFGNVQLLFTFEPKARLEGR